jgi:hypothetical protein
MVRDTPNVGVFYLHCFASGLANLTYLHTVCVGWPELYMHTVYDRTYDGGFPAKITVHIRF